MTDMAADAGGELAERRRHAGGHGAGHGQSGHERVLSIAEAVLLSLVALVAAWSGYCAASWDTLSSDRLAQSLEIQVAAQAAKEDALQIRTFDSVSFDAAFSAYVVHDQPAFELAVRRLRPEYRRAFRAWLALHPLKNRSAPADPSLMPQYRVTQAEQARALTAKAHASFLSASAAGNTSDKYVRITVILATVLFLIGISGHFTVRLARYGLIGIGCVLITYSLVQILGLPGPPG
jgi:hypothetical protein